MPSLLIDLDGVVYQGEQVIEGAPEALGWIIEQRIPHLFVTNTTSRPRRVLVRKLAGYGIAADVSEILTPPVAARRWLLDNVTGEVALLVPSSTREEFAGVALLKDDAMHGAAAVVVGDLGEDWTFSTLNRGFRLLMAEPRPALVALGMTRYWRAPDGLRLDTGPFVVALAHAAGVEPVVLGKPAAPFFQSALSLLQERRESGVPGATAPEATVREVTVMVGDDIRADVGAAQQAGLEGVLVRTGKFRDSDLALGITPEVVIDSIADLPAWWSANRLSG